MNITKKLINSFPAEKKDMGMWCKDSSAIERKIYFDYRKEHDVEQGEKWKMKTLLYKPLLMDCGQN